MFVECYMFENMEIIVLFLFGGNREHRFTLSGGLKRSVGDSNGLDKPCKPSLFFLVRSWGFLFGPAMLSTEGARMPCLALHHMLEECMPAFGPERRGRTGSAAGSCVHVYASPRA